MTATAMAKRLAADTPALRANDTRVPLTGRQREIIALTLAAAGLTNRQIADRLDVGAHGRRPPVSRVPEDRLNSRDDPVTLIDQRRPRLTSAAPVTARLHDPCASPQEHGRRGLPWPDVRDVRRHTARPVDRDRPTDRAGPTRGVGADPGVLPGTRSSAGYPPNGSDEGPLIRPIRCLSSIVTSGNGFFSVFLPSEKRKVAGSIPALATRGSPGHSGGLSFFAQSGSSCGSWGQYGAIWGQGGPILTPQAACQDGVFGRWLLTVVEFVQVGVGPRVDRRAPGVPVGERKVAASCDRELRHRNRPAPACGGWGDIACGLRRGPAWCDGRLDQLRRRHWCRLDRPVRCLMSGSATRPGRSWLSVGALPLGAGRTLCRRRGRSRRCLRC